MNSNSYKYMGNGYSHNIIIGRATQYVIKIIHRYIDTVRMLLFQDGIKYLRRYLPDLPTPTKSVKTQFKYKRARTYLKTLNKSSMQQP